jgi:hypothetical protein
MEQAKRKISLKELKENITQASLGELGYLFGRYCGPHNKLLREKIYENEAANQITALVSRTIADIEIHNMLTDQLLADSE